MSKNLILKNGARLTIASGGGLKVDGNYISEDANALTGNSGSSIIIDGVGNNTIKYNRNLPKQIGI